MLGVNRHRFWQAGFVDFVFLSACCIVFLLGRRQREMSDRLAALFPIQSPQPTFVQLAFFAVSLGVDHLPVLVFSGGRLSVKFVKSARKILRGLSSVKWLVGPCSNQQNLIFNSCLDCFQKNWMSWLLFSSKLTVPDMLPLLCALERFAASYWPLWYESKEKYHRDGLA